MKQIILYICIIVFVLFILYFFYQNTVESLITNTKTNQKINSEGWNLEKIKNGNLYINNTSGEVKLLCNTGYNESQGICCGNGQYNSQGICCNNDLVNDGTGKCIDPTKNNIDTDTKYNNDKSQLINIQYHKTEDQLMSEAQPTDVTFGNAYIYDENGNQIPYPFSSVQGYITYYTPGSYPFGTANYVPNYENTIYFSKLTGQSTTTPVYNTAKMLGGFCNYFDNQPSQKEIACSQLDPNQCGSTNCCVLLGGEKCVSGDTAGPTYKTNYGDVFIKNKDFYYYQGVCYGNCA